MPRGVVPLRVGRVPGLLGPTSRHRHWPLPLDFLGSATSTIGNSCVGHGSVAFLRPAFIDLLLWEHRAATGRYMVADTSSDAIHAKPVAGPSAGLSLSVCVLACPMCADMRTASTLSCLVRHAIAATLARLPSSPSEPVVCTRAQRAHGSNQKAPLVRPNIDRSRTEDRSNIDQ